MNEPARSLIVPIELLRQAAQWRLLALLFEPPGGIWHGEVASLAEEAGDPHLAAAAESARREADPAAYHSAFGPGGPVPLREVSYRKTVNPGRFMAEISSHYQAFAYAPSIPEPLDHVASEAGFVAYLCLKEAYAQACGQARQAAACRAAAARFVEEHLGAMAEELARRLQRSSVEYLARAGAALVARVRLQQRTFAPERPPDAPSNDLSSSR